MIWQGVSGGIAGILFLLALGPSFSLFSTETIEQMVRHRALLAGVLELLAALLIWLLVRRVETSTTIVDEFGRNVQVKGDAGSLFLVPTRLVPYLLILLGAYFLWAGMYHPSSAYWLFDFRRS